MNPISQKDGCPLVSISCITYNHAPYIRQCLEGFMMQKTNFAFEVLIHDDASTDGTTEIIKEYAAKYPDIIKPLYEEENQWVKGRRGSAVFNYPRAKGKYIAMCEGDDYWIDPLKLQKQVDILEKSPHVTMVYTGFRTVDMSSNEYSSEVHSQNMYKSGSGDILKKIMRGNYIQTVTVCFRRDALINKYIDMAPCHIDYLYFLIAAALGNVVYIPEATSAYRINPKGLMCTSKSSVDSSCTQVAIYVFTLLSKKEIRLSPKQLNRVKINYFKDAIHYYRIGYKERLNKGLRINGCMCLYAFFACIDLAVEKLSNIITHRFERRKL